MRSAGGLVSAMFAAELRNLLLTAGHDLDAIEGALTVDLAVEGERYQGLGGRELATKAGDMLMRDAAGIVSSILHGPDQRTRLRPVTERAVFTVYAPDGIDAAAVRSHLEDVAATVRLVAPAARAAPVSVFAADGSRR